MSNPSPAGSSGAGGAGFGGRRRRLRLKRRQRGERADDRSGEGVHAPRLSTPAPVLPGRSTTVSFTIQMPAGKPLTAYKQCCVPHAGVDLIMVRSDDSHALYEGSDIAADGRITQRVVFPAPGRYRIVHAEAVPPTESWRLARERQARAVTAGPLGGLEVALVVGTAGAPRGVNSLEQHPAQRGWPLTGEMPRGAALIGLRAQAAGRSMCRIAFTMEHEHTQHIAAAPDQVFAVLGDVGRLPEFVPQMTGAHAGDGDSVVVDARYEGHTQHGEAWFRADPDRRRVEWGSRSSDYHGWMQVDPDGDGSRLTLFLSTAYGDAPDSEVMGTLDAIRRLVEAQV